MVKKRDLEVKEVEVSFTRRYKLSEKICPVCGKRFMGTGKAKYDSVACQQKANYQRHREKYLKQKKATYRREKLRSSQK